MPNLSGIQKVKVCRVVEDLSGIQMVTETIYFEIQMVT